MFNLIVWTTVFLFVWRGLLKEVFPPTADSLCIPSKIASPRQTVVLYFVRKPLYYNIIQFLLARSENSQHDLLQPLPNAWVFRDDLSHIPPKLAIPVAKV